MSTALRSVIITLPKGIQKAPIVAGNDINFATSIISNNKTKMEPKRLKIEELDGGGGATATCEIVKPDGWLRGKKRRLDHLTWEEKLQRKKLKNRVAAQTSRDRKKAKLDELEDTVRSLREENDRLSQECQLLRTQNESLMSENSRLKSIPSSTPSTQCTSCNNCQTRVACDGPTLGSAAGWPNTIGTTADPKCSSDLENIDTLPPLDELFGELQGDDYIDRLEELAESLLREVTAEVEANTSRANEKITENTNKECDSNERMVGTTSENVEACTAGRGINNNISGADMFYQNQAQQHINDNNSLIHKQEIPKIFIENTKINMENNANFSVKNPTKLSTENTNFSIDNGKILKKQKITDDNLIDKISNTSPLKHEIKEEINDLDTVYGTYDEATNCITIICPDDEHLPLQECVQEVSSDDGQHLSAKYSYKEHLSPGYISESLSPVSVHSDDSDVHARYRSDDCGYESHDSPRIEKVAAPLADPWHESFSILFPSLA